MQACYGVLTYQSSDSAHHRVDRIAVKCTDLTNFTGPQKFEAVIGGSKKKGQSNTLVIIWESYNIQSTPKQTKPIAYINPNVTYEKSYASPPHSRSSFPTLGHCDDDNHKASFLHPQYVPGRTVFAENWLNFHRQALPATLPAGDSTARRGEKMRFF